MVDVLSNRLIKNRLLQRVRKISDGEMPDSVVILNPAPIENEGYGAVEKFTDGEAVKCRFIPKRNIPSATEGAEGGASRNAELYTVVMPLDTVVTNKHRLRWKGAEYEIVSDVVDRSHQINIRVIVKAIK